MILTSDMYVPALRWRMGEYQALLRTADSAKDRIVPFTTIPEIEFDFEERRPKKSVQEHVHPFAARYKAKWGKRPAWVGVHNSIIEKPMDDGRDIFTYVFDALRMCEAKAIPAIPLNAEAAPVRAVASITKKDRHGVAISVRLEDLMKPNTRARIQTLTSALGVSLQDTDLVVDLGAPNYEPYDAFAGALIEALRKLGDLFVFRNSILIGTAIPKTFRHIAKGADEIPRHDWMFYRALTAKLPKDVRRPNFGDYTIVHPDFTAIDMRKIKSAGKVVYTNPHCWLVRKGGAFRDNPEQMHDLCASIIGSGNFKGPSYSSGDDYIDKCAMRKKGHSNQTKWKEIAINHHITHVVDDLATFDAAS
jgi:T4 beta protein